jgi:hypothetical protein
MRICVKMEIGGKYYIEKRSSCKKMYTKRDPLQKRGTKKTHQAAEKCKKL